MLSIGWILSQVRRIGELEGNDGARALGPSLAAIEGWLDRGLAIAGAVVKGEEGLLEVRSWRLSPAATVRRIEREWRELGASPDADWFVWVELTERGREWARALEGGQG